MEGIRQLFQLTLIVQILNVVQFLCAYINVVLFLLIQILILFTFFVCFISTT